MTSKQRFARLAVVAVVFIAAGLVMDLLDLHSTVARALFVGVFIWAVGEAAGPHRRRP